MGQTWDAGGYARNARFVTDLGAPVVELLAPARGERILDLGCGDGVLTAELAARGCAVIGLDPSPEMVAAARELGLEVVQQGACEMEFQGEFDAVFSNAALHWIRDADEVIRRVFRALRPGGRFVAEFGGHGCVAAIEAALIAELQAEGVDGDAANPWSFPTAEAYAERLARAGFQVPYCALIPRPTPLPGDILGWLETFSKSFTAALPEARRAGFLRRVRDRLRPKLCDADSRWTADYVRLRLRALKLEGAAPLGPSGRKAV